MFQFSKASDECLSTVNPTLQTIMRNAIKNSPIDFGIPKSGGLRTAEEQYELFQDNKTKCDGYTKLSNHQSGNAVDVYAYVNGKASWQEHHLAMIAGVVLAEAKRMGVKLCWGGTFGKKGKNLDGWDKPHFELSD
ncbi:M15 family metallopeptidase [Photobacterium sagamiensis]|uniref:M15 family metallopeptidase n=1 Tax=Photobacterium sagamiensis TaxID=2910241 RepID=UPI003D1343C6